MNKRKIFAIIMLSTVALTLGACGEKEPANEPVPEIEFSSIADKVPDKEQEQTTESQEATTTEAATEEENREGMYRSELTNEWIDESLKNQRPIAVMVDNEKTALPHYGLTDADVVYELMNSTANGRITRLMALVKDWDKITQFGSIRSVRPTNFMLAAEWNAILCHDGGPFYIKDYLAKDYSASFSGGFSRVKNGKPTEYTEYICTGDLEKQFNSSKVTKEYNEYYPGPHYKFSSSEIDLGKREVAVDANEIILPFPHNSSTLKYNKDTKTYDYYEYGSIHTDAGNNDKVLSFKNLLIQECDFYQYDENGYMVYFCNDLNNKSGYYVTNGKAIPVIWAKATDTDVTVYYDKETGKEIEINTGKTYVTLVPSDSWKDVIIK